MTGGERPRVASGLAGHRESVAEIEFGGAVNQNPVAVQASNRILVARETPAGSIAVFPPVHNSSGLGRSISTLGLQLVSEKIAILLSPLASASRKRESDPADAGRGPEDRRQNFALRSARPGTLQRMPVYLYVSSEKAQPAVESALAYTRQDRFKPLPGYEVMATHFHAGLVRRLLLSGGLDNILPDFEAIKSAGMTVFAPIDGGGLGMVVPGKRTPPDRLETWLITTRWRGCIPTKASLSCPMRKSSEGLPPKASADTTIFSSLILYSGPRRGPRDNPSSRTIRNMASSTTSAARLT